jgi:hypothetical protein
MKTISHAELEQVNGGLIFLAAPLVYAFSGTTISGVATALGIGTGVGVIVGGLAAVYTD